MIHGATAGRVNLNSTVRADLWDVGLLTRSLKQGEDLRRISRGEKWEIKRLGRGAERERETERVESGNWLYNVKHSSAEAN